MYKKFYDASWEMKPMDKDYSIVEIITNDDNYIKHVDTQFYFTDWDCFSRGNKTFIVIDVDDETLRNFCNQFTKSGCKVNITKVEKQ